METVEKFLERIDAELPYCDGPYGDGRCDYRIHIGDALEERDDAWRSRIDALVASVESLQKQLRTALTERDNLWAERDALRAACLDVQRWLLPKPGELKDRELWNKTFLKAYDAVNAALALCEKGGAL